MCCCSTKKLLSGFAVLSATFAAFAAQNVDLSAKSPAVSTGAGASVQVSASSERAAKVSFHSWNGHEGGQVAGFPDTCAGRDIVACNSQVVYDNTAATTDITDPGYSCFWDGSGSQGNGTIWLQVTATDDRMRVQTCNTTTPGVDDTLIGVYSGTCAAPVEIACGEDNCTGLNGGPYLSDVTAVVSTGTAYLLQIATNDGFSVRGAITIDIACFPPPPPVDACDGTEDVDERAVDPACGVGGDPDGGCNAIPPVFLNMACGQSVCGSSLFDGATRDTDWFNIGPVAAQTLVRWSGIADFESQPLIISDTGVGACVISINAFQFAPAGPYSIEFCYTAGAAAVYTWMGPQFTTTFPCGNEYSGLIECETPCVVSCPADLDPCAGGFTVDERAVDPTCGVGGDPDGGCNSIPPLFLNVVCGDVLCGSAHFDGATRDTDWMNLGPVAAGTRVTWSGVAEFDSQPLIISDDGACGLVQIDAFQFAAPGPFFTEFCYDNGATAVYLWFGSQFTAIFPCDCEYSGTVACGPCVACQPECEGDEDVTEVEPDCGLPTDTVNGGCNSTPPVFGSLECGQSICGTTAFDTVLGLRDTDWYKFTTSGAGDINWTVSGQNQMAVGILTVVPDCNSLAVLDFDISLGCNSPVTSTALAAPAGEYVAFAATDFIGAPPCGTEYEGLLECVGGCGCPGDLDGDCDTDQSDLGILLAAFLVNGNGDLDNDGDTDQSDLGILLADFGCDQ